MISQMFVVEGVEAVEERLGGEAAEESLQLRKVALHLPSSLGIACRRLLIVANPKFIRESGSEEDRRSALNLSFFVTVEGFRDLSFLSSARGGT